MLQVIHRIANNLWSDRDIPAFVVILGLKLYGRGKDQSRILVRIEDLAIVWKLIINIILERIKPWYETQLSEEQNGFKKTAVQQMEYDQLREFTKY